mmetsp:Transcript_30944/g.56095  ORF Transcript_30944/g.56095 Transcript_30944/m.56095 type:complete len:243 (-) Transcript_30944:228-956(-)
MLSHAKILVPLLAVIIGILASTIGPSNFFLADNNNNESSIIPLMSDHQSVNIIDGMPFPSVIKVAGSKQSLIGGGTRSKWGFRVYAVGIYGDQKLTKSLKKKYPTGDSNSSSTGSSNLSSDFSESKQAKTLLLRFHRSVASSDISDALGEALVNKVGEESSQEFSRFILGMVGSDRLEKGSELFITCKGEKLSASLTEGNDGSTISIKGLCSAIFMVYLGGSPVSPQAKEGFEKGFADLVVS